MKNAFDQSLAHQSFSHYFSRRILIVGISILTILFVLLLADIFYIQFPQVTQTGDANLQRWIGPDLMKLVGLFIGLLFGTCYLAVAIWGTREKGTVQAWKLGAAGGAGASLIILLLYAITSLNTVSLSELLIPVFALYGFTLLGNLVVGFLAGKNSGQIRAGTIAGFWFGAILALVAGLSVLARDMLFAQHLASTVWIGDNFGDLTCRGAIGTHLIGCEVGDSLGFAANNFLMLPLLGLLLGTAGAALGKLFAYRKESPAVCWSVALVAPLICIGFLLIILIAEAIWNLW